MTLHETFDFARADALRITGCPEEFQNERNLVYRSFALALAHWGCVMHLARYVGA